MMADIDNGKQVNTKPDAGTDGEDPLVAKVHSANDWEHAEFGDADRKSKFLRLMGAGKKEHHGKIVIGDHKPEHGRSVEDVATLQHKLEDQYEQSLQHRLVGGRRGHMGLGYHGDVDAQPPDSSEKVDKEAEEAGEDADNAESGDVKEAGDSRNAKDDKTKSSRKRESCEGRLPEEDVPAEKKSKSVEATS